MKKYESRKGKWDYRVGKSAAGLGVFADEDIPKGEFIIEYYGPIISAEKADDIQGKYLFELNDKKVVNGTPRYNKARYLNHGCRPNCETDIVRGKVYVYSKKNIKEGDELCYNYGKEYFNDFIKDIGCKCHYCSTKKKTKNK